MALQSELYQRPEIEVNGSGSGLWRGFEDALVLGLRALSDKALFWLVTLGAIGLWTYAAVHPEFWRLIAVGGYSVGIFLPILLRGR